MSFQLKPGQLQRRIGSNLTNELSKQYQKLLTRTQTSKIHARALPAGALDALCVLRMISCADLWCKLESHVNSRLVFHTYSPVFVACARMQTMSGGNLDYLRNSRDSRLWLLTRLLALHYKSGDYVVEACSPSLLSHKRRHFLDSITIHLSAHCHSVTLGR